MADIKISELLAASTPLDGTETLPIVQNGNTVKAATQDIASLYSLGYTAEDVANKSTDSSFAGATDLKYPSQLAVKTYVDNTLGNAGWSLTGNSGTTSANFIGTTDAKNLVFKVNNSELLKLDTSGMVNTSGIFRVNGTLGNAAVLLQSLSDKGRLSLINIGNGQVNLNCENITNYRTLQLPDASGTLVATVNGTAPDSAGNVVISGGSGNTTTVKVSLSSAQILALSTTPITLVTASSGKTVLPIQIIYKYNYGTINYSGGLLNTYLNYGDGASFPAGSIGLGSFNISTFSISAIQRSGNNYSASLSNLDIINNNITVSIVGAPLTSGNGTLDIYLTYTEL